MAPTGRRTTPAGDDQGAAPAIVLGLIVVLVVAFPTILTAYLTSQIPTHGPDGGRARMQQAVEDLIDKGDHVCCPDDPSAGSLLQDLGMEAWANQEAGDLETVFKPWFPAPEITDLNLIAGYVPQDGELGIHEIELYKAREPGGQTVGAQYVATPSHRGPAYVIPRLDVVGGDATIDVHFVPLAPNAHYRQSWMGHEATTIETWIDYTRTASTTWVQQQEQVNGQFTDGEADAPDVSYDLELQQRRFLETARGPGPAINLTFEEPDWVAAADALPGKPNLSDFPKEVQLVLTAEDLQAERLIKQAEDLEDGIGLDDLEDADEPYPQHGFQVNVTLSGPGWLPKTPTLDCTEHGTTQTAEEAYLLHADIPRNWTQVAVVEEDALDNQRAGWSNTSVTQRPDGSYKITSLLAVEVTFECPEVGPTANTPRYVLRHGQTVPSPFRFHARPPQATDSNDLGFQTLRVRVEAMETRAAQDGFLVVELANNPGRVHRTVEVLAPQVLPRTPLDDADGVPRGIRLPLGAVFKNGGESVVVENLTWTAPPGTFVTGGTGNPAVQAFTELAGGGAWSISGDGSTVRWRSSSGTCPALRACAVGAWVLVDGANLTLEPVWPDHRLTALYGPRDVAAYVDWFVRTERGHAGLPEGSGARPGFAMAHRQTGSLAGEADGAFLWSVRPSTEPICGASDQDNRNRDQPMHAGGWVTFNVGPREDGYPHVSGDAGCWGGDEDGGRRRFALVGQSGSTEQGAYGVRSIGWGAYTAEPGLGRESLVAWRNGLSEARIEGPSGGQPGDGLTFEVVMEAFFDQLTQDGITEATVVAHVYDPYNAWEHVPWTSRVIAKQGDIAGRVGDLGPCDLGVGRLEKTSPCREVAPAAFEIPVRLPSNVLPGTHLLVVEVSWDVGLTDGGTVEQTARLIRPFDVHLPGGRRGELSTMGGVAWIGDWG